MSTLPSQDRSIGFLHEDEPDRASATLVAPGVRRVVAANPGPMTYHGTNSYVLDGAAGAVVIDPGPDLADHVEAVLAAAGGRIACILLTHRHHDHCGAAAALQARTGAPVVGGGDPLPHGERVGGLAVLATPGHTLDHVCYVREEDGLLFTGDHVMSWSSSIVSPTKGDMSAYMNSLALLIGRNDRVLMPGHGPVMEQPRRYLQALLDLRLRREKAVLGALAQGPLGLEGLSRTVYPRHTHPRRRLAAEQNVLSHLLKLRAEGLAREGVAGLWETALPVRDRGEGA